MESASRKRINPFSRDDEKEKDGGLSGFLSVLHLGSEYVRALVVETRRSGSAAILGYGAEANPLGGEWSEDGTYGAAGSRARVATLAAVADRALRAAEDNAARAGQPLVPDQAVIGVPSSALWGRVYRVCLNRSEPSGPVSRREVQLLWERAERLASVPPQVASEKLVRAAAQFRGPMTLFSLTSAGLFLDDHLADSPVGLQGANLALAVCALYAPAPVLRELRQIAERLELDSPWLVAEPQAVAVSLPEGTALGLDIGRWHTTAIVVRGGTLAGLGQLSRPVRGSPGSNADSGRIRSWGGRDFSAGLARTFRCPVEDAEALQRAYATGSLPESGDSELVGKALQPLIAEWGQRLGQTLAHLALEEPLPRVVYVYGGTSYLPRLLEDGLGPLLAERSLFSSLPEVRLLDRSSLPRVEDRTGCLSGREKVGVLSLAGWASLSARPDRRELRS
jgi:hypothetical protein